MTESGFLVDRLGAGIDHVATDGGILCPGWNEAPAKVRKVPLATSVLADNSHLLSRGDVVAGLDVPLLDLADDFGQHFRRESKGKAAAHRLYLLMPLRNIGLGLKESTRRALMVRSSPV